MRIHFKRVNQENQKSGHRMACRVARKVARKAHKVPTRAALTIVFAAIVFCILAITMVIMGATILFLVRTEFLKVNSGPNITIPIAFLALASIVVGTVVAIFLSHLPLKPVNKLIYGMNRLASGDYNFELDIGNRGIVREVSDSFNILANELSKTEMLRSDFVNEFSHEFKTPIVSIRGFAKLLRHGDIPEVRRTEYLDIIVDESSRLADMATSILNLAKVENQNILTEVTLFNLSEQLRNSILLLEKKWSKKNLSVIANFNEYDTRGNEELLKQVWINLIDNAVKFSPEGSEIEISLGQKEERTIVVIKNYGEMISDEEKNRIFRKFYQGDSSHSLYGNGIGLAIAKRIVDLHNGNIDVQSSREETSFSVELPA